MYVYMFVPLFAHPIVSQNVFFEGSAMSRGVGGVDGEDRNTCRPSWAGVFRPSALPLSKFDQASSRKPPLCTHARGAGRVCKLVLICMLTRVPYAECLP